MVNKISPLKDKPLRQAGQSVQEQINDFFDDKVMPYLLIPLFLILLAGLELFRYLHPSKPHPYALTVIAVLSVVYSIHKILSIRQEISNLRLGRDGEKEVAEELDNLRATGCIVFHDIRGNNFNLDHVVLSQKGIFVVETKTFSKPTNKEAQVHFDGKQLNIDGLGTKNEILTQVEAESTWLKEMLKKSTGKDFMIKPVIVFPGWFINSQDYSRIWVLNPKGVPKFIEKENNILNKEDVMLAAYHLSRYIRSL